MALSKVDYNSLNVTAAASKALKWNSGADGFETGDVAGSMVLIKTLTASSSATLDFVDGTSDVVLDNTYPIYLFKIINCHPSANASLSFNGSDDDSSHSYDVTKTSTLFTARHYEDGTSGALGYQTGGDLAQGSGFQKITEDSSMENDNDASGSGELWLFNPSSTTYVKHFMATMNHMGNGARQINTFTAGYFNTTADITAIQFKMDSGNIDAGTFKLYGVS